MRGDRSHHIYEEERWFAPMMLVRGLDDSKLELFQVDIGLKDERISRGLLDWETRMQKSSREGTCVLLKEIRRMSGGSHRV